jgi:hypothetical protein
MTSFDVAPSTAFWNCSTDTCRPSMIALRWLAMPCPWRALLSASASAFLTTRIFAAGVGGDLLALRGVDVVHGGFDLFVGDDVGHEDVDDLIAEAGHVGIELELDGRGDGGLGGEDFVQGHAGDVAEDDLLDVGLDLGDGIGQTVEGVVDLLLPDAVLHADGDGDEDVVFGLGLHGERDLVDAQADDSRDRVKVGSFPVEPGLSHAQKLAETRDDGYFRGAHGEKAAQDKRKRDDGSDGQQDQQNNVHAILRGGWAERIIRSRRRDQGLGVSTLA